MTRTSSRFPTSTMDSISYRQFHEQQMQNNNGTSMLEIFSIITLPYFSSFLVVTATVLLNLTSAPAKFLLDFVAIVLPVILYVTVLNRFILETILALLLVSGTTAFLLMRNQRHKAPFILIPTYRPTYTSLARSLVNMMTAVCILAVDFQCFPRKLAKTETFGFGLMDVGVGLYVFINGLVARDVPRFTKANFVSSVQSTWPLFVLGVLRFVVTTEIDYQQHVSEYGVHWNFFLTLACTKILGDLILGLLPDLDHAKFVAIIIMTLYEMSLQLGLGDYLLSKQRTNLLEANKEGLGSLAGYVAIYISAAYFKNVLRHVEEKKSEAEEEGEGAKEEEEEPAKKEEDDDGEPRSKENETIPVKVLAWQTLKLALMSVCLWKMVHVCNNMFGVSRRLANMGYVIWVTATGTAMVALFMLLEMFFFFVKFDRIKLDDKAPNDYGPLVLKAINTNGLVFFLVANLLTGLVNLLFQTMLLDAVASLLILVVYMLVICAFQTVCYTYGVKLKFW